MGLAAYLHVVRRRSYPSGGTRARFRSGDGICPQGQIQGHIIGIKKKYLEPRLSALVVGGDFYQLPIEHAQAFQRLLETSRAQCVRSTLPTFHRGDYSNLDGFCNPSYSLGKGIAYAPSERPHPQKQDHAVVSQKNCCSYIS